MRLLNEVNVEDWKPPGVSNNDVTFKRRHFLPYMHVLLINISSTTELQFQPHRTCFFAKSCIAHFHRTDRKTKKKSISKPPQKWAPSPPTSPA